MKFNINVNKYKKSLDKYGDMIKSNLTHLNAKVKTKPKTKIKKEDIAGEYNSLLNQSYIGEYLNYRSYESGIFENDGNYGFCMFAVPLTGASELFASRMMGLFQLRWPQGATLSFMLYSSKEIKSRLDAWVAKRQNAKNPLVREMAKARAKHFSTGVNSSLIKDEKILVRDYRMVISVTFNGELTKDKLQETNIFKKTFYSSVNNLGFNTTEIDPNMLLDLMDEIFNRKSGFRDMNYRCNPFTDINKQITGPSTRVLVGKDALAFNDTIVRGATTKEYPGQTCLAESLDLIGDLLNDNTQISSQFLYCTNIWFPDTSSLKTTVNTKSARAIQNAESPMAKWVPDFASKAADWKEALKILSDGQNMYYSNGNTPEK